ncbi:UDP-N-acetylmuramoyl-L-alanine--D-glutamate ligase [Flavobacterium johnsoniae]|uniref:UDP-N-acetylmuramoylalanine--D-glutamate ligase n=1 Tax=Flavobacterium johnsoniae (strain ATCC 17061 / DSM 2064 / JCM 8514 / BCRC 14874 / CCUG 350202 / NBRC 14942 / NCIMB 11054 / UW101) TaxID=376686 RepID=A5FIY1_FLAJ1|nr:UDP-N-acetylmuramoyl-L-alanine--D-glutamate ligase [Flavobacterium johnsoniae]ABQ04840.1 UDP-N-acetylmuramoylalanine--D-glutamate ligase [Flavobacterium johnsoniae UW101]OXG02958.1 UDP-N-acetylmuramoyl-L-alanine--D-glutamate ligase [Flavobacterium johnsoniae UW101]WQG83362.1 UDP-N-acetylmuramoyl-L-alanine--D-glutamate ligase [Flavobacterium johnsoniae UW101]SHK36077.1 UDP-N-acetylmuramoylalanine--D-glutamate ligase [Flavobacterium johnsoniae]
MRLVVLGGGESGVGTAILGKKKGYDVFVSDFGKIKESYKEVLIINKIDWEEEQHTEDLILNADVVMKSPGIPDKSPIIKKLVAAGVKVISEIEFAKPFTEALTIGITGSNGKTTTTMLTHHLLKSAGLNVGLGGNIGKSFAWQVAENKYDAYVLELSSFQLDGIIDYRPDIAIITNISPDHLDRYEYKYENYINSKFRITMNQTESDYLIYDADDEASTEWLKNNKTKAKLIPFSLTKTFDEGASINNNKMEIKINQEEFTMETEHIALEGKHNMKNAMAASSVAKLMQIRNATIRESLSNFQGVEHRLEKVLKIQNVQYINDSKATNVNATFFALDSMNVPTVWIVGGVDKGNDYNELMSLVREKVKAIICLGIDNRKIIDAFGAVVDIMVEVNNMNDAVKTAQRLTEKGDAVLLSPACASFDLFENYEDRGKQFKQAVHNL